MKLFYLIIALVATATFTSCETMRQAGDAFFNRPDMPTSVNEWGGARGREFLMRSTNEHLQHYAPGNQNNGNFNF